MHAPPSCTPPAALCAPRYWVHSCCLLCHAHHTHLYTSTPCHVLGSAKPSRTCASCLALGHLVQSPAISALQGIWHRTSGPIHILLALLPIPKFPIRYAPQSCPAWVPLILQKARTTHNRQCEPESVQTNALKG